MLFLLQYFKTTEPCSNQSSVLTMKVYVLVALKEKGLPIVCKWDDLNTFLFGYYPVVRYILY